jgi:uncharacterized membrane protein
MLIVVTITTVAHIASGAIAVLMGAITFAVRKGAATHINAGRVFTAAMGLSSLLGAILGLIKHETFYITFHAGVLGMTLVLSGWMLARGRTEHRSALFVTIGGVNLLNSADLLPPTIFFRRVSRASPSSTTLSFFCASTCPTDIGSHSTCGACVSGFSSRQGLRSRVQVQASSLKPCATAAFSRCQS